MGRGPRAPWPGSGRGFAQANKTAARPAWPVAVIGQAFAQGFYLKALSYQATVLAVLSLGLTSTDRYRYRVPIALAHKAAPSAHAAAFPPGH